MSDLHYVILAYTRHGRVRVLFVAIQEIVKVHRFDFHFKENDENILRFQLLEQAGFVPVGDLVV